MEASEYHLTGLDQRFDRLRHIIEVKRAELEEIEHKVRICFRQGDVAAIAELSRERARLLDLVNKLEIFVEKWEKEWQDYQHLSDWVPSFKIF